MTATPEDSTATVEITVDGNPLANGNAASWNEGGNAVEIAVANGSEGRTYTVAVTCTLPTPPQDARLSGLTIGSLQITPAFDPDTVDYAAGTSNATNTVTATPVDGGASIAITLNGSPVDNGGKAVWADGENILSVRVESGGDVRTYTVLVAKT